MDNPWALIPHHAPFVLDADARQVASFNASASEDHRIRLDVPPEPFLGNLHAKVVLLNLNPGYDGSEPQLFASHPEVLVAHLANLCQEPRDWPFTWLDPTLPPSSGRRWWESRLRELIEATSLVSVAEQVLCVEWFGYHSTKFKPLRNPVPSQEHAFDLVRAAIDRGALIVAMRAIRRWTENVPALATYSRLFKLNSAQSVHVSRRNCPAGFDAIVDALARE